MHARAGEGASCGGRLLDRCAAVAHAICPLPLSVSVQLLNSRYEQLYSANSVEKSGSFYLQSKIFRAKEVIDDDFERRYGFKPFKIKVDAAAAPGAGPAADAKAGPSATTPPPS